MMYFQLTDNKTRYIVALTFDSLETDYEEWENTDGFLDFMAYMETKYGVHDGTGFTEGGYDFAEYTSDEITDWVGAITEWEEYWRKNGKLVEMK